MNTMTITDVSRWYNHGEISVDEAIHMQQQLCSHTDHIAKGVMFACLKCGLTGPVCVLCLDRLAVENSNACRPCLDSIPF